MEHTLYVVGIGPGNPAYVVPRGLELIREATHLVGSERALVDFAREGQETFAVTGKLSALVAWLTDALAAHDVVVTVSGDTGYYSLLPYLKKQFPDTPMEVVPGISSMTFAFARLKEVWQDADLMSFHGRKPPEEKLVYAPGRKMGFLTDNEYNPSTISQLLITEYGWPEDTRAAACERLSYEDERIVDATLGELVALDGFCHSVLVVIG